MNHNIVQQYKTADNLNIRRSIHEKYSTNKQPFGDWIFSHYEMSDGYQILELGCGTAAMWKGSVDLLPSNAKLVLSDFSLGMLETAKKTLGYHPQVDYACIDIQSIPYPDSSFDAVIANMMLYHVPDLHKGLREVRRVLKPGGRFYCATYGENGIMEFIRDTVPELNFNAQAYRAFTLQNGAAILQDHFDFVNMCTRDDGLAITCVDDFVDYILSMSSMTGMDMNSCRLLRQKLSNKMIDGVLYVPKEYGMFICK